MHGVRPDDELPRDVDPAKRKLKEVLADLRRWTYTRNGILAILISSMMAFVIALAAYYIIDRPLCFSCEDYAGPQVYLSAQNGTSNWTLIVAGVHGHLNLDSVRASIYYESGGIYPPLVGVRLSALTDANWTTYHVRYQKLSEETEMSPGARIIIEKSAYPEAHHMFLSFESHTLCQTRLP